MKIFKLSSIKRTKRKILFFLLIFCAVFDSNFINAQSQKNYFVEWTTWTLIQAVPSPVFFQDKNEADSRMQFGFRWQVTPLSYCFNANKLVSPFSAFLVNPLRRHSGSVEILAEPEWTTAGYKFSNLDRFSLATGVRGFIPLQEYGEYLSASLAFKYNIHNNKEGMQKNYPGIEAGIYSFFGILGIRFNYNFSNDSRYNIGINLKYF